jgi:hypothetical protein
MSEVQSGLGRNLVRIPAARSDAELATNSLALTKDDSQCGLVTFPNPRQVVERPEWHMPVKWH